VRCRAVGTDDSRCVSNRFCCAVAGAGLPEDVEGSQQVVLLAGWLTMGTPSRRRDEAEHSSDTGTASLQYGKVPEVIVKASGKLQRPILVAVSK
jgi:hypothetical protein